MCDKVSWLEKIRIKLYAKRCNKKYKQSVKVFNPHIELHEKFEAEIIWKRFNTDTYNELVEKNRRNYIKFKNDDPNVVYVMSVDDIGKAISKTLDDIEWIAKIPKEFDRFQIILSRH